MRFIFSLRCARALFTLAAVVIPTFLCRLSPAAPITIRVATYNIEADVNGVTTPRSGLYQVIEGMGEERISGVAQPVDVLALQETTSNATTVAPIVTALNSFYGSAATYAQSSVQGTQSGGVTFGNGPNALVYNSKTLTLVSSVGVGTPHGATNGEYRQVMRYQLKPVSGPASSSFYVYVSHMKSSASGTAIADETARAQECQIIRNDQATLPAGARVLYMGDYNLDGTGVTTSGSQSAAAYQTITAAGNGQAFDPLNNPQNNNVTWSNNSAFKNILTESSTNLRFRDDLQLMTSNVFTGTPGGLDYVPGSLHAFGNNGTTNVNSSVNNGSNTAFSGNDLGSNPAITASELYADLTTGSDHLPVLADYTIDLAAPEPASLSLLAMAGCGLLSRRRR